MRTVLCGISLFIDKPENVRQHFILNGNGGEESKIVERERERVCVCVCVWQCVGKRRDSIGHKMSRKRNTSGRIKIGLICEIPTLT
jgi:hypothetical protein